MLRRRKRAGLPSLERVVKLGSASSLPGPIVRVDDAEPRASRRIRVRLNRPVPILRAASVVRKARWSLRRGSLSCGSWLTVLRCRFCSRLTLVAVPAAVGLRRQRRNVCDASPSAEFSGVPNLHELPSS